MGLKITKLKIVKENKRQVVEPNCDSQDNKGEICVVCQEPLDHKDDDRTIVNLRCGHQFHLDCIGTSFNAKNKMKCPTCRNVESGRWMFALGPQSPDFNVGNPTSEEGQVNLGFTPNLLFQPPMTSLVWPTVMPQPNSTSMGSLLNSTPQQQQSETSLASSHAAHENLLNRMIYGFDTTISNHRESRNNSRGNGDERSGSTVGEALEIMATAERATRTEPEEAATGRGVGRRSSGSGCGCIHCRRFSEFIDNL